MKLGLFSAVLILAGCGDKTVSVRNAIPEVVITSPASGYVAAEGEELTVEGHAGDADDAAETLSARWTVDGEEVCSGAPESDGTTTCTFTVDASHSEIQLVVVDPSGGAGEDSITITVEQTEPPVAEISSPVEGEAFSTGELVELSGSISDTEDDPADLTAVWTSSLDADFSVDATMTDTEGTIEDFTDALIPGEHALTLTVTDSSGKQGSDSVIITIVDPETNAPEVVIVSPLEGEVYREDDTIRLAGTVSDVEDANETLNVVWTSSADEEFNLEATPDSEGNVEDFLSLTAGEHGLTLTVTDSDGLVTSASVLITVRPPNEGPTCEITSPASGSSAVSGTLVTFEATVGDDDPVDALTIEWLEDTLVLATSVADEAGNVSYATSDLAAGTHNITLSVTDADGEVCTDDLTYTVGSPPTVTISSPVADERYYAEQLVELSGVTIDDEDDEEDITIVWTTSAEDDLSELDTTVNSDGTFSSFTTLSEGEHALVVTATDTTGLTSEDTVIITVGGENTPPTCDLTSPASGDTVPSGTITFEGTADDPDEPEDMLSVSFRTEEGLALGDTTPDSSGAILFLTSALEAGTHQVWMEVEDEVGATCSRSIILNVGGAPSVLITSPADGSMINDGELVTFEGLVTDDEDASPDLTVEWTSSIDATLGASTPGATGIVALVPVELSVGTHTITLTATDTDDESASTTIELTVNGLPTAPVVEISPDPPAIGAAFTASILTEGADPEGDAVTYTYAWSVDGASSDITEATVPEGETSSGEMWTVTVTAHDEYGTGGSTTASVTVNNAPVCSIDTPSGGDVVPSGTIDFTATTSDTEDAAEALMVEFFYDLAGGEFSLGEADADTSGDVSFSTDVLDTGLHLVTMVVTDTLGDSCTDTVSFGIGGAPTVSITAPTDGTVVNEGGSVSFAGTAIDDEDDETALTIVWSSDLDGTLDETAPAADGSVSFDADDLSIGSHTITLTATDTDGETNMDMITVTINGLPDAPVVQILPENPVNADDLTASIATEATDPDGDTVTYTYAWSVDGADAGVSTDTVPAGSTESGQTWTVTVTANDEHGPGASDTDSVTINSPPTCAITSPESSDTVPSGTIIFEGTADDPDETEDGLSVAFTTAGGIDVGSTAPTSSGSIILASDALDIGTHVVTMVVTDSLGESCSDSVVFEVGGEPTALITAPADGSIINEDETIEFTGNVQDEEDSAWLLGVAWTTDVAGETLDTTPATSADGSLSFSTADLSVGAHTITLTTTDTDGQTGTASISITINGLPTVPTVTIAPDPAATTDNLVATASGSTDEDGDDITYSYAWTVGGVDTEYATDTVPASATSSGEVWEVTVTPSDAYGSGDSASASVTIENTAPVVDSVTLSPDDVYTNTTITATATYSDADDDSATLSYEWTVSGTVVAGATENTLSGVDHFDKGDTVFVTVTATDADGSSTPVVSDTITVLNTAPTAHTANIEPDAPIEGEDPVVCTVGTGGTDADGDTIVYSFSWTVDGEPYTDTDTTVSAGDTVPASATVEGEVWACTITSTDGEDAGPPHTAEVTILVDCDKDDDGYEFERADCETVAAMIDCDDADASINPGVEETWYDGIDSDCSGGSDCDADGDGFDAIACGGEDCADEDPARIDCSDGVADYLEGEAYGPVSYHSLETDGANDRLVLYGGQQYHQLSGSTNAYNLTTDEWEVVATAGIDPGERMGHASAMDEDSGKMYVFGGQMYHTLSDELMVLDTTTNTWSFVEDDFTAARPPPLTGASMVYDPNLDELHIFGGQGYHGLNNELWTYSVATDSWVGTVHETGPVAAGMVAIFNPDAETDGMTPGIAFGGQTYHKLADTGWCFDGDGFSALTFTGETLPPAVGMAHALAPTFGGIVAYGGQTYHNLIGDAYLIRMVGDCTVEVELLEEGEGGPPPTVGSAMAWSADDAEAFLVGGQTFYKLSEQLHGITP